MRHSFVTILLAVFALTGVYAAQAQPFAFGVQDETVTVSAQTEQTGVMPGGQMLVAVTFDIIDGFHIQPNNPPHDWQIPTRLQIDGLPEGVFSGDMQWPELHPLPFDIGNGPEMFDFFSGKATVFIKLSVGEGVEPGEYPLTIQTTHQACDDTTCLPPADQSLPLTLVVTTDATSITKNQPDLFKQYTGGSPDDEAITANFFGLSWELKPTLGALLLLAVAGGFLLNFTPCVLPLIPIKVLGISQHAGHRGKAVVLGAAMSLGVIAFWLGIGVAIASVAEFDAINKLFQYTEFNVVVGSIIVLMGLGVFGLFTTRLPQWVYRINPTQDSLHGSFGFGVMTAVLSTPCTAPFMGSAAAYAAKQEQAMTLMVFAAIGVGMALPYFVLTLMPRLVEKLPRTGPGSELMKRVMGLMMIAAGAYFLGSGISSAMATPPDPASKLYWVPVFGVVAGAAIYMTVSVFTVTRKVVPRLAFSVIGMAVFAGSILMTQSFVQPSPVNWIHYTPERLAQARAEGKTIVLDFTAEWCLNCHALEKAVLYHADVYASLNADHVAAIKVDITKYKPAQQLLTEVGSTTIPLLIIEAPDGTALLRSDAYTRSQVIEALEAQAKTEPIDKKI